MQIKDSQAKIDTLNFITAHINAASVGKRLQWGGKLKAKDTQVKRMQIEYYQATIVKVKLYHNYRRRN